MFIGQMLPTPFTFRTSAAHAPHAPQAGPPTPMRPEDLAARAQGSSLNSAYDHLLTPETLASLLALNEDGSLRTDAQGNLQMKNPGGASEHDWFVFGLARAETRPPSTGGMSGDDAAFFQHMTGCTRVEMGGGLFTIRNAEGQPEPLDSPAWQLASLIPAHREAGYLKGEITAEWFMPWAEHFVGEGLLSKDWLDRARDWFAGDHA